MAVDVSNELIRNLEIAAQRIATLERAIADERRKCEAMAREAGAWREEAQTLAMQLREMHTALAAAAQSAAVTAAARPAASRHAAETATQWVTILGHATGTDPSTVRWNLTYSDAFVPLRDNAEAIDGLPLTQSIRLLCWLAEHVSDGYGHKPCRYEALLRRQISLERLLDS